MFSMLFQNILLSLAASFQPTNYIVGSKFQLLKGSSLHQLCLSPFKKNEKQELLLISFFSGLLENSVTEEILIKYSMTGPQDYWGFLSDFHIEMILSKMEFF